MSINLILIGPPGSGKSTIAEALIAEQPLVLISTGQRLRAEVKSRTRLGNLVQSYIDVGQLVPDSLMDRVLRSSLDGLHSDEGLVLDGYPRTVHQALGLAAMLADYNRKLDYVVSLDVGDAEVVRRLSGRRICETASDQFPVHIDDLASIMRCRERGGRLVHRADDQPEVVRERLRVYHAQTAPVLVFYESEGLLQRVDASDSPAEVARRVLEVVKARTENREPRN